MATLADIAAALNLNKTTVSKALNNSSDISRETKERVLAEAARVGYVKHRYHRRSDTDSQLIGIICPEVINNYYAQIANSLTACLQAKGYNTLLMLSNFSAQIERQQLSCLVNLNAAGIVIITEETDLSDVIGSVPGASRVPIVIMGMNYRSREHDVVSIDEEYGIRCVVEHLHIKGHRRIAFLGENLVSNRLNYLRQFLNGKGIDLPDRYVVLSDKRSESCGYECMKQLLSQSPLPTAVFAGYDTIALGAYRALCEAGLRVPEDIALVGFDDAEFCRFLPISVTSVDCDIAAQCRITTAILISRIKEKNRQTTQSVAITPNLIERESTSHQVKHTDATD